MIYYAGIGSRKNVPEDVLNIIEKLGYALAKKGFCLRSGHAENCDQKFEAGCDRAGGQKEIYIPWKGFNGSTSNLYQHSPLAEEKAFEYHPNLYAQKDTVVKLMARNTHQVLGPDCIKKTASKFIVCYCPVKNGVPQGGTAQALRIASDKKYNIPIFNLFFKEKLDELKEYINGIENED